MIKRDPQLILLNQTIAYKSKDLKFVNFTDNLLVAAGVKSEEAILGKRDDEDFPWSKYADEYHKHDIDALNNISYSAIVPFSGTDILSAANVLCTRTRCDLEDGSTGILIHVVPLVNPNLNELIHVLKKTEPSNLTANYYIGKNPTNVKLTNKESECLFYLIRGKSAKFIARIMNISYRTVEFHIDNLKNKFACRNKSELISYTIQNGYMSIIPSGISVKSLSDGLKEKV